MIKTTELEGDLSTGRHLGVGGNANVQGNTIIKKNLKVEGWLDAKNIKGPNKGMFLDVVKLREAYPLPDDGWWAFVGNSLPAPIYIANRGVWSATGESGGLEKLELNDYPTKQELEDNVTSFVKEFSDVDKKINLNTAADNAKIYPNTVTRIVNDGEFIEVHIDANNHLLEGTTIEGVKKFYTDVEFQKGVPLQIRNNIDNCVGEALLEFEEKNSELANQKVDKVIDKSLIDKSFAERVAFVDNEEWAYVVLDANRHVVFGFRNDGSSTITDRYSLSYVPIIEGVLNNSSLKYGHIYIIKNRVILQENITLPSGVRFIFLPGAYINLNGFTITGKLLNKNITTSQLGAVSTDIDANYLSAVLSTNIADIVFNMDYSVNGPVTASTCMNIYGEKHTITYNGRVGIPYKTPLLDIYPGKYMTYQKIENLNLDGNYGVNTIMRVRGGRQFRLNNIFLKKTLTYGCIAGFFNEENSGYSGNVIVDGMYIENSLTKEHPKIIKGSIGFFCRMSDSILNNLVTVNFNMGLRITNATHCYNFHPWNYVTYSYKEGSDTVTVSCDDDVLQTLAGAVINYGGLNDFINSQFDGIPCPVIVNNFAGNTPKINLVGGTWFIPDGIISRLSSLGAIPTLITFNKKEGAIIDTTKKLANAIISTTIIHYCAANEGYENIINNQII